MSNVLMILLACLYSENFVYSRFIGVSPLLNFTKKPLYALVGGIMTSIIMALTCGIEYAVAADLLIPGGLWYFEIITCILIAFGLVTGVKYLCNLITNGRASKEIDFKLFYVNTAVIGCAMIALNECVSFVSAMKFGLLAGLALTIASFIIAGVREKMKFANPPEAFKGVPSLLIAIGLVIMALSGLNGIQI